MIPEEQRQLHYSLNQVLASVLEGIAAGGLGPLGSEGIAGMLRDLAEAVNSSPANWTEIRKDCAVTMRLLQEGGWESSPLGVAVSDTLLGVTETAVVAMVPQQIAEAHSVVADVLQSNPQDELASYLAEQITKLRADLAVSSPDWDAIPRFTEEIIIATQEREEHFERIFEDSEQSIVRTALDEVMFMSRFRGGDAETT